MQHTLAFVWSTFLLYVSRGIANEDRQSHTVHYNEVRALNECVIYQAGR